VPCFNPAGLAANTRVDGDGVDLNRAFDSPFDSMMLVWRELVQVERPWIALCLHEDFDAVGCYVYELSSVKRSGTIMRAVDAVLPRDRRAVIEGMDAADGVLWMSSVPRGITGPEAIELYAMGCTVTMTFETPSEFSLDARVLAQVCFLSSALEHLPAPDLRC
jgi:murein peptide amidase A